MAEYIEREVLMRQIKEIHCAECNSYHGVRCRACWVDDTFDYIDSEPAVDVAPVVHGRWELEYETYGKMRCSVCKKEALIEKAIGDVGVITIYVDSNYCPNCGAKMDEKDG